MLDRRPWLLVSVFLVAVGCTGAIDDPGTGTVQPPGGSGNQGVGNPGTGGGVVAPGAREPGRVTLRRLNQTEYDNTVRDLLGIDTHPARVFITDSQANGFDNNGDLLSLSPVRLEQYQQAAETLATTALAAPLRTRNLACDAATGDACVKTFLATMGERAYRRPLTDEENSRYLKLAAAVRTAGGSPEEVMNAVLQALLISPSFLFRPELDPSPTSMTPHLLAPYEQASRLSYLVYASMPDDALFAAAKTGKLATAKDLQAQLERLLADPKSRFAQSYAEQWLGVRSVETAQPDPKLYPAFNAALGLSMKREVDLFIDEFVHQNLPIEQLLTANFSYVDTTLAQYYGLPAVTGTDLTRVTLATPQRGGLLGMGAVLTATSRGNRTSPVSRGRFVLDALMCAPPPPAPGDVKIPPEEEILGATSQRDFLAKHRANPTCAACHTAMDAIGLALENYDAIGAWRAADKGNTIDPSGNLPDGTKVTGPRDLAAALAKDPRIADCLTSGLMNYSLGRALRDADRPYVEEIAKRKGSTPIGLRDLLMGIVASDPFRMRRGEPATMGGI